MTPLCANRFAEVAVNSPISRGNATFHYALPEGLPIEIGQLVLVPFGTHRMQGVVLDLVPTADVDPVKEIEAAIDAKPVLTRQQVAVARWLASYYAASLFDAVRLMLPPGLAQNLTASLHLMPGQINETDFTPKQRAVVDLLRAHGPLRLERVRTMLKMPGVHVVVAQLVRRKVLRHELELRKPQVAPRLQRFIELAGDIAKSEVKGLRQRRVLDLLERRGVMPQADVIKEAACDAATIAALAERGLVSVSEHEVRRDPLTRLRAIGQLAPTLTPTQEAVWREICDDLDARAKSVFLLHGVTGSGKTEIYLRAVERVLRRGEQAIVLVPEIALTPQTVHRFAARFPGAIALLHSKLSPGERYDEWRRIRGGEAAVVIGSRSAVFAPVANPGLIVLDEEHEWSYKQDKTPRYHAREVALRLGELSGATVILGSATPDVESYYRASTGRYRLLKLDERVLSGSANAWGATAPPLPPVQIVDMRSELKEGNRGIFSRTLRTGIARALAAEEQVILFLNRRGTSSFVICRDCGFVLQCRRCDFSLVFHGDVDQLVCHQCNERRPVPRVCPSCSSSRIKFFRAGTQKVEEEARLAFPGARVMRWDRDVTGHKMAHEDLLRQFASHEADILVGTQMIAKGLDLPRVTLVGVISADVGLHLPDPRAGERTFQLLVQVAGRAGRGALAGSAVVQTYSPGHYGIEAASRHDYQTFFDKEIAFRRQHGYPPFGRLARLVHSHPSDGQAERGATKLAESLTLKIAQEGIPGTAVYGPAPAFYRRVRGKYRWQIFLRGAYVDRVLHGVTLPLGWIVDVDPVSML